MKSPPTTTVASGLCTSAPTPVASIMGTNPRAATSAVMSTGRARSRAALMAASAGPFPSSSSASSRDMRTTPFSTAMPERAMKPTAAEMETGMPRRARTIIPPTEAKGTFMKMSSAGLSLRKAKSSTATMRASTAGMTRARRRLASSSVSYWPPHSKR